ncbi:hypothetical protein LMG22037_03889 [Paraburkholderia phenoliruptrix]|uniref:Uncharacterized protein n=1 Tax=Paraburkholderia phenoliruptrix TaxID=252970 RepID=A0A6J5BJ88_9BURK|nr:hypothetical protein LMG22037_03889 [Paraburkholderia phenoliruptrix]
MLPASHCVLAGRGGPSPVARDYARWGRRQRLGEVLMGFREAALECGSAIGARPGQGPAQLTYKMIRKLNRKGSG